MFDGDKLADVQEQIDAFREQTARALERRPERQDVFRTHSGDEVKALYTPLDVQDLDYSTELACPGCYPYTRGVQPNMYRGKLWTMRLYSGFATAEESNERYKYLVSQGSTGLSVAFDLPTQIGYDSDSPYAEGEVGKVGVAIDSLADMETLFDGIPLDEVSTSMTINAPAAILLAMYVAVAEKQRVRPERLSGTIQNDILKEYIARGAFIFPTEPSMRLTTDIFEHCSQNMPEWNTISISGYHIREAGATAAQELGFTLANGIAYVEAAIKTGMAVDDFAPRLTFFFNAHNDMLEEIAKFPAARRLWAKIMKERFKASDPKSMMLRFHAQTAGSTLTAQQPDNNIVRVAIQTLAAVLGGAQSLHTNSRDEALALPTEESARIALRTQQVVAHESGVANTVDPLAGSYYIEWKTRDLEQKAKKYIATIDEMGGAAAAIDYGYTQREIADAAYAHHKEVEAGTRVVVGLNEFVAPEHTPMHLLKVDPSVGVKKAHRLATLRRQRDGSAVDAALAALKNACSGSDNLLPYILDAVRVYATLGEICSVMREVFGEHRQSVHL